MKLSEPRVYTAHRLLTLPYTAIHTQASERPGRQRRPSRSRYQLHWGGASGIGGLHFHAKKSPIELPLSLQAPEAVQEMSFRDWGYAFPGKEIVHQVAECAASARAASVAAGARCEAVIICTSEGAQTIDMPST